MTNDIELITLPEPDIGMPGQVAFTRSDKLLQEWCRANVAHATAAKDAEIEALLSKLEDAVRDGLNEHCRVERLAEALREVADRMAGQAKWVECDCGCPNAKKPVDAASVTWLRAAAMVRAALKQESK